jgi:hypothetical protein
MLAAVQAAILDVVTNGHSSYSIEGRSVTRLDLDKLRKLEKEYSSQVAHESGASVRLAKMRKTSK